MGFIERLRQQKETTAQVSSLQAAELQRKREAEETERQQRTAQEKEYHQQRRLQAETFRQENGVGILVAELGRFLVEEIFKGVSKGPDYEIKPPPRLAWDPVIEITYPSIPPTDPDSTVDIAIWDMKYLGHHSKGDKGWEEAEQKFLAVETKPDGNVVFHARKSVTKPEREWRINKDILDKALEEAFYNPRIHKFEYRHHEAWHEAS